MIKTWIENAQLYTDRQSILNWEHNNQTASEEKLTTLSQDRSELVDMGPLLVMPSGDYQNWICLGGNKRNQVDGALGATKEWIKPVNFKQKEEDERWYACEAQIDVNGNITGWVVKDDKKSFSSLFAAQKYYSYKHNNNYGGIDPNILSSDKDNPELEELNWNEIFTAVGDPGSVQKFIDKIEEDADSAEDDLNKAVENQPTAENAGNDNTLEKDKESEIERFENRIVKCPSCGEEFDPKKHRANNGEEETSSDDF